MLRARTTLRHEPLEQLIVGHARGRAVTEEGSNQPQCRIRSNTRHLPPSSSTPVLPITSRCGGSFFKIFNTSPQMGERIRRASVCDNPYPSAGTDFRIRDRESIWDRFATLPGKLKGGDTPEVACDHYHRYEADADLMRELGIRHYRLSIAWPKTVPRTPTNIPMGRSSISTVVNTCATTSSPSTEPSPKATTFEVTLPGRSWTTSNGPRAIPSASVWSASTTNRKSARPSSAGGGTRR